MSLVPIAAPATIVLAVLAAAALIWWPQPGGATPSLLGRLRRSLLVLLVLAAALRPGVPGGLGVRASASDLNVFFVVDTTVSSVAEDYDGRPRLEGMREDIKAISGRMAGARFALISFDRDAVLRMPLTSDGAALASAADTLLPETSAWSRGSSVTIAGPKLQEVLALAQSRHPERARLVFYLGDGEQTSAKGPEPMGVDRSLVNGGMVLGYGTSAGGQMRETGVPSSRARYLTDKSGQPARSVIDEARLADIAGQLGVPYLKRNPGDAVTGIVDKVDLTGLDRLSPGADGPLTGGARIEYYWIPLLAAAALLAWEVGLALSALWELRRPGAPRGGRRSQGATGQRAAPQTKNQTQPETQPETRSPQEVAR
ncbi:MAG TPA: VWA domain-containing protein [Dermatophilaceae bacterium]|nr:VWA domain-containing protein [Dermatophilaceae bacterium]